MPATFSKPTKTARWADTGTRVEPSEAKKDTGWVFEEVPPFSFFNYLQGITGDWHQWLDERLADGATKDELKILAPGNGSDALLFADTYLRSEKPLRFDGDDDFVAHHRGSDPSLSFKGSSGNTYVLHDVANDHLEFWVGGVEQLRLTPTEAIINADLSIGDDLVLPGGLVVGFSGTPIDDQVQIGDADFKLEFDGTDPALVVDGAGSELFFDRGPTAKWYMRIAGQNRFTVSDAGANVRNGLFVGDTTTTPTNDEIIAAGNVTAQAALKAENGLIYAGTSGIDYLYFGSNQWDFYILDNLEMRLSGSGLAITNGLYVGSYTGTPTDNDIYAQGSIEAGTFVQANTYLRGDELYLVPQTGGTTTAGYVRTHSTGNRMSVYDGTTWLGAVALKYAAIDDPPQEIISDGGYENFPDQVVIPGGTLRPGTVVRVNASFRLKTYDYDPDPGTNTPSGTFRWYINAKGPSWSSQIINTGNQQRWWYIEGTIEAEFTVYQSSTWDTITNLKAVARRNNGGYAGSYDCTVLHTAGWDWGFHKSDQDITLYASIYDSGTGDVCQLITFTVEILEAAD